MCGITHDLIDFGTKKKEMSGIAEEIFPNFSNFEPCLMADEVTNISRFINYDSDEKGIRDLEHLRKELDLYEREFQMIWARAEILEEEKNSLEKENSQLIKISKTKDVENAFLKALISETEKSHKEAMSILQKEFDSLRFENEELKKIELSFQSYAKASDTLTEVHSYLRDPSEKGGLGLNT